MTEKLQFELVSPERLLIAEAVDMVVVPGAEGDFGVLKDHAPLISGVRPGVLDVHDEGQLKERIFVAGGFAEVTGERLTVLAEEAVPLADIDRAEIESRLNDLRSDLAAANNDSEREAIAARIDVAEAKLAVSG
ncbi:MAG TPA: F0F1 ATP synthase subunit epsilon [Alphaproteobacteria bacterium]|nr:F0F1 ATP synthase subunit epsilon [Alphaproteobacteria bacterium]